MNHGKMMSVTGCLKEGTDTGGYYIKGDDGKTYELMGKNLGEHVGHTVKVSGHTVKMTEKQEKTRAEMEKTESGGSEVADMRVSNLKMVSEKCK